MRPTTCAALTATLLLAFAPQAMAGVDVDTAFGVSAGGTQILVPAGAVQPAVPVQPSLGVRIEATVEDYLTMSLGAVSRDLIDLGQGYGIQSSGVAATLGGRLGDFAAGIQGEVALVRNVAAPTPGVISLSQGLGFLWEPYVSYRLTPALELTGYYPIWRMDPALGPRAMLTFWVPLN